MKNLLRTSLSAVLIAILILGPTLPAFADALSITTDVSSAPVTVTAPVTTTPVVPTTTPTVSTQTDTTSSQTTVSTGTTTTIVATDPTTPPIPTPPVVQTVVDQTVTPVIPHETNPPIISGVTEASVLPTEATILWTTDELATSQFRYGTTTNYGLTAALSVSAALTHTVTLLNLDANTTYHYCIDATDVDGYASTSCNHSFTTAVAPVIINTTPPVVDLVTTTPITTTSATINWITDKVASGEVEYGTTASYGNQSATQTALTLDHSVTLSDLTPNTLYHYRVRSTDQSGNIAVTPDNTFTTNTIPVAIAPTVIVPNTTIPATLTTSTITTPTTPATPPVTVPQTTTTVTPPQAIISAIDTPSISTSAVTVSWNTDIPSDTQMLYGRDSRLGSTTLLDTALTTSHSVTITGLSENTNYMFKVQSKPAGATIETVSIEHEFTTLSMPVFVTTPATLSNIASSNVTETSATVTWNTDIGATSQVHYGIFTGYGQSATLDTTFRANHSVALSNLTPDTVYHYQVVSKNSAGDSTISTDYTFTTSASAVVTPRASAATAISTLTASSSDQTSATLSWNVATPDTDTAQEYDIRYSTTPITEQNFANATSSQSLPIFYADLQAIGTSRQYVVVGLTANTTYYFALKAKYMISDWSVTSNVVSVMLAATTTTAITVPSSQSTTSSVTLSNPLLINATAGNAQIVFNWDNPEETNYVRTVVVRKLGGYPSSPTDGQTLYEGDGKTFTDIGLMNGQMYYYAIYSYDHDRNYSGAVNASLAPIASVTNTGTSSTGGASRGSFVGQTVVQVTPVIEASQPQQHFVEVLQKGSTDLEVEHLQRILVNEGNLYPTTKIDSVFGSLTQKGLMAYQLQHNLPQTGITDTATQDALNRSALAQVTLHLPADIAVFNTDLKYGTKGENVNNLQEFLMREGSYQSKQTTGIFDIYTKQAVQTFQKKNYLPTSGFVGPRTRHLMTILTRF